MNSISNPEPWGNLPLGCWAESRRSPELQQPTYRLRWLAKRVPDTPVATLRQMAENYFGLEAL